MRIMYNRQKRSLWQYREEMVLTHSLPGLRRAGQPMDDDIAGSVNRTLSAEADNSTGSSSASIVRCSICRKRIWVGAQALKEPAEAPEPQQSWMLCKVCHAAVMVELERSPVRTPMRVRIAVGLVAAERWPRAHRNRGEREDRVWIAFLYWGFAGMMLLHLLIIVLLAEIAK